ncbi:MAG: hypothetical protein PWQ66_266 [Petrotoga sp.]|nr:hypothetical protein [Petrotoga sp.]
MFLLRLDDASEYRNTDSWQKIENLLDKHNIKPIVGVIPNNKDESFLKKYQKNENFWEKVIEWRNKGWTIALHGYNHIPETDMGGVNPINKKSEFAGLPLELQREKIREGVKIFNEKGIESKIFFAPFHTFDLNTLKAIQLESKIRIINDTIANDIYKYNEFYFIPQQAGSVRNLPLKTVTFCYHPNEMKAKDFDKLDLFLTKNINKFITFEEINLKDRKFNIYDRILKFVYFSLRKFRNFHN